MRYAIILLLAGALLLSCGCGGESPASQWNASENESHGHDGAPSGQPPQALPEETAITACEDGTPVGNCSADKPKICDIIGNLVDDAETCGCPPKTIPAGRECIHACSDGTLIEECSEKKPYYCNENAKLEMQPALCGCPEGYDFNNGSCRNACSDGTLKLACSEKNKPLYCNENYELVKNPPRCGCYDWEIFENEGCFDPYSKEYSEGEKIRVGKGVQIQIYDFEEKNCGGNTYGKFVLKVTNKGNALWAVSNKSVRLKRGASATILERPEGCAAGSTYRWGEVSPGEERYGNVWFLVYGGTGDFYVEYEVEYPTIVKSLRVDVEE